MEMHVPHRAAMSYGFRLGDPVIHRSGLFLYLFRQMQSVDQFPDMPRRGVMMVVMMIVRMIVSAGSFFLPMYCHPHMRPGDPAGLSRLCLHMHAGQSQTVHGFQKSLFIFQQFIQGAHQHIAGCPHVTFDV